MAQPERRDHVDLGRLSRRRQNQGDSTKQGSALELPDRLIAAVAVRLQKPLVTGNNGDFQTIQKTGIDFVLENWRDS